MENFLKVIRALGIARLLVVISIGLGSLAFFGFLTASMNSASMTLLYSELSPSDSAEITGRLQSMNVSHEISGDGSSILVPADRVGELRMSFAASGLPSGGSIGYELFDRPQGFGMTHFVQNINHLRAMEGELARTIMTLSGIKAARVHLVLPKQELFSRTAPPATASVFVKLGGYEMDRRQIGAIRHLVASAVPNLKPTAISVVDDSGRLLAGASEGDQLSANMDNVSDHQSATEQKLARRIEDILSRIVGYGRVRAEVSAQMNFDRVVTESETFDPDSQVLRSAQTMETTDEAQEADGAGGVSIGNSLPGAALGGPGGASNFNRSSRTDTVENFEIDRTVTNHIQEVGKLEKLSVAVLVDGKYETSETGEETYTQRTSEELARIEQLVKTAIGFDEKRGDTVTVTNMQFAPPIEVMEEEGTDLLGMSPAQILRALEVLVMGLIGILVIFLVLRPVMSKALVPPAMAAGATGVPGAAGALPAPSPEAEQAAIEAAEKSNKLEQMINMEKVEGKVRASSIKKLGEVISEHPDEAVNILRGWMYGG